MALEAWQIVEMGPELVEKTWELKEELGVVSVSSSIAIDIDRLPEKLFVLPTKPLSALAAPLASALVLVLVPDVHVGDMLGEFE